MKKLSFLVIIAFATALSAASIFANEKLNEQSYVYKSNTNYITNSLSGVKVSPAFSKRAPSTNDRYLLDGFPVYMYRGAGSYQGGAFIDVTANDVDGDGKSEIFMSSLASGPLNGVNHDGSAMSGFPIDGSGVAYTASLDNYVLAAFNGDCEPTCKSYVRLFDASTGSMLWSKSTVGIGVDAAPIMFKEGDDIFIVYENSVSVTMADIDGNILPGWPVTFPNHATYAAADFNNDGVNEVVVALAAASGMTSIRIYNRDGSIYSTTPSFGIQVRTYPSIGDVDGDGELEIVAIGRVNNSPWNTTVNIFNHDGTLQSYFEVNGRTAYGVQASLADVNNDSTPEILFITESHTYVVDADGNNLPGWPKEHTHSSSYGTNSNVIVADVISDGFRAYPEIIYVLRDGFGSNAVVKIYNHDGTRVERWDDNFYYPLGNSRSLAIQDINNDGFNEILIPSSDWTGISGFYPELWAFNLNKNERPVDHAPVEWGMYGNNSSKTSLYVKPNPYE